MSAATGLGRRLATTWTEERDGSFPFGDPREGLRIRNGTRADYAALAEHHYRAKRPATATRVLVLDRPVGWKSRVRRAGFDVALSSTSGSEVVAVLVESLPALSCRMRDAALGHRYGSHLDPADRGLLLNDEVRCISRVVVDPRWRGLGLAVRLVRHALATATTPVTEALAAMGRVHPFFARAGMTAYPRPPHDFDARLVEAFAAGGFERDAFLEPQRLLQRMNKLPVRSKRWLCDELRRWFRRSVGRGARSEDNTLVKLRAARERFGLEPVYYAWVRGGER
ncbi:MAG: hypothetical protein AAGH92_10225 [Planctomycetota bacterium]